MSAGRGPADPPAKNIRCDAKDHARPRKYLEQNTFPNRGVQVKLENRLTRRLPSRSSRVGVDDPAPVLGDEAVHDLAVRGEGAKRPDLVDAHEAAKPATSATKIAASLRFTRPVSAIGTSRPFRPQRRPPPCQDASIPVLEKC
jgi:hypothetical protein